MGKFLAVWRSTAEKAVRDAIGTVAIANTLQILSMPSILQLMDHPICSGKAAERRE